MKEILRRYKKDIDQIIELALHEDIGEGDITTELSVPASAVVRGSFMAKGTGVLCGLPIAKRVFQKLDKNVKMTFKKKDGAFVKYGDILAIVRGKARTILTGERLALNILQRLSGVATITNKFVQAVKPYKKVKILDTRKTTPNLRILEKYAVKVGGGDNHRMGLYDAVVIKDNHIRLAIDIQKTVVEMRRFLPKGMKIEIEADDLDMLEKAAKAKPDIIMLDNMCLSTIEKAMARLKEVKYHGKVEVSGGIDLNNVRDVATKGVDFISVGLITHSPEALDISFKFKK